MARICDLLDAFLRPLGKYRWSMPNIEEEYPARRQMTCGGLKSRLQSVIGRLVTHYMKKRDDCIKGAAEIHRANIADFASEGAGSFGRRTAAACSRDGNHLSTAFDAVDIKPHFCEEPSMATGA